MQSSVLISPACLNLGPSSTDHPLFPSLFRRAMLCLANHDTAGTSSQGVIAPEHDPVVVVYTTDYSFAAAASFFSIPMRWLWLPFEVNILPVLEVLFDVSGHAHSDAIAHQTIHHRPLPPDLLSPQLLPFSLHFCPLWPVWEAGLVVLPTQGHFPLQTHLQRLLSFHPAHTTVSALCNHRPNVPLQHNYSNIALYHGPVVPWWDAQVDSTAIFDDM